LKERYWMGRDVLYMGVQPVRVRLEGENRQTVEMYALSTPSDGWVRAYPAIMAT